MSHWKIGQVASPVTQSVQESEEISLQSLYKTQSGIEGLKLNHWHSWLSLQCWRQVATSSAGNPVIKSL